MSGVSLHHSASYNGLPAGDARSLHLWMLLKAQGLEHNCVAARYPWNSSTGSLPALLDPSASPPILNHTAAIRSIAKNEDLLVAHALIPLMNMLDYELFAVQENYAAASAKRIARGIVFPVSAFVCKQVQKQAVEACERDGLNPLDPVTCRNAVRSLLEAVNHRLENQKNLASEGFTADTLLASCLLVSLFTTYPKSAIRAFILEKPALLEHIRSIVNQVIPEIAPELELKISHWRFHNQDIAGEKTSKEEFVDEETLRRRRIIKWITLGAFVTVGGYVLTRTLLDSWSQKQTSADEK